MSKSARQNPVLEGRAPSRPLGIRPRRSVALHAFGGFVQRSKTILVLGHSDLFRISDFDIRIFLNAATP
jgi:hypothetical protein